MTRLNLLMFAVALVVVTIGVLVFDMLRTPAGIERDHRVEGDRIFSSTRTVTQVSPVDVIRLLDTDWSWWKRARAQPMKDLGDGRKEFYFHPVCPLGLFEGPPGFLIQLGKPEGLPNGGCRISGTMTGDLDGPSEYSARPAPAGTIVELACCGARPGYMFRFTPIAMVALIHCWRERIGIQGLRKRLALRLTP